MSDLFVYEFEDIAWDEFCMTDDHTVPGVEKENHHSLWSDNCRKLCHEVVAVQDNVRDKFSSKNACQEKEPEKLALINNRRKRTLEKDLVPKTPDGVFTLCNRGSDKEDANLAPDANRRFSHCFKSNNMDASGSEYPAAARIPIDKTVEVDSNSCSYPLPEKENDINFFDETHDIKDSGDFLYYGWPDIGNLEDVDRIFSNEDEFGWFASSEAVEASIDGAKPEFKFSSSDSSLVENKSNNGCEHLRNETHLSVSDTCMKDAHVISRGSSWLQEKDKHESLGHFSFVTGIYSSDTEADFMPIEQGRKFFPEVQHKTRYTAHSTNGGNEMPENGVQSRREGKYQHLENGGCTKNLLGDVSKNMSKGASAEVLSCMGVKQQPPLVRESLGYLPCNIQYTHSDYSYPSDQTSEYSVRRDSNGFMSPSPKEAYSSNLVLSADSSHGISYQTTPINPTVKVEKLHHKEALQSSFSSKPENIDMVIQIPFCDPVSLQKKVQHPPSNFDTLGDAEEVPVELGSSTLQESSSVSSALDEMSLEAASFCQLQLVMEQLDLRTKLCIRDSLYRLARSAAQRHNDANLDQDASTVETAEGANKCTGFMYMETDTNPIDRSIAHLLFHRPSAPNATPTQESSLHNTATAIHGCILKPHVVSEKLVDNESGPASEAEGVVADP